MANETAKMYVERNLERMRGTAAGELGPAILHSPLGRYSEGNLSVSSIRFVYDASTGEIIEFEGRESDLLRKVNARQEDHPNKKVGCFDIAIDFNGGTSGQLSLKVLKFRSYLPGDRLPLLNQGAFKTLEETASEYNRLYGLKEE